MDLENRLNHGGGDLDLKCVMTHSLYPGTFHLVQAATQIHLLPDNVALNISFFAHVMVVMKSNRKCTASGTRGTRSKMPFAKAHSIEQRGIRLLR